MKKLIALLVVFSLFLFAGLKVLVWYQVNASMTALKDALAKEAIVDWGWIASDLSGTVTISDIHITPFFLKDTLRVDRIQLRFGAPQELLWSSIKSNGLVLPHEYEVEVVGGHLPLANKTLAALVPSDSRYREVSLLSLYGCGEISQVTGRELLSMGYDQIGFSVNYSYSAMDGMFQARGQLEELFEFDLAAKLLPDPLVLDKGMLPGILPLIRNMETTLQDTGYFRRLSFLCGRLHGLSQAEYLRAAVDEWAAKLSHAGINVGSGVSASLLQYADTGSPLTVTLAPMPGTMKLFASLFDDNEPRMSADTIISAFPSLGLHLSTGTAGAMAADIRFDKTQLELFLMTEIEKATYLEALAAEAKKVVPVVEVKGYKPIEISTMAEYLEQKIQVEVVSGKLYEGVLSKVAEKGIVVTQYLGGGSFAYPIANEEIALVRVWK